jgi:hypothetical protein
VLEGTAKQYAWVERNASSGSKTGRTEELGVGQDPEEKSCWSPEDRPDSQAPRVTIETEEHDQLLSVTH